MGLRVHQPQRLFCSKNFLECLGDVCPSGQAAAGQGLRSEVCVKDRSLMASTDASEDLYVLWAVPSVGGGL